MRLDSYVDYSLYLYHFEIWHHKFIIAEGRGHIFQIFRNTFIQVLFDIMHQKLFCLIYWSSDLI